MALQKRVPAGDVPSLNMAPSKFSNKVHEEAPYVADAETASCPPVEAVVDIDLREVYFLIMHFLSAGPCRRTVGQFWNELLEHQLLPRRYHAWYSRSGERSGDENDSGLSFPLSYSNLVERYPHIGKDHLVKLLKQLMLNMAPPLHGMVGGNTPKAADVPTILGSGYFSLLESDRKKDKQINCMPRYLRWPHIQADQVRGLSLRELGGGFTKHHRAPSIRAACYAIAKPSTMVQKMQNIKKLRGHRDAVYCATFDCAGRYVITGSDDRLVKIWSMETAFCLASCRGHEGDITDLAVSSNNALVASSSNDFVIRVWRLPDGFPISVLRGHTGVVTTIAFSPRPGSVYQLLSSSDDGTCRMWDARYSNFSPRVYIPRPLDVTAGKSNVPASSIGPPSHQILCCAFNANGTVFVTGSSDTLARVWNACKSNTEDSDQANHEMDVLSGHENDVNYVQFSGCAVPSRYSTIDALKEDNVPKFKNSWFTHDNIVTCSRDGSAIIWIPRSRRSHGKVGRWTRAYHLKVPPPPMPPQPPRGGPRGGPRQRFLPTPRGVNMIVWSLDNRFVLAAIMDCRICVWNAADGSLVHSLTGHSESTYVLDVHPFNPRMAMSAGYDGKTILWDIWEGTPIRIYETGRFKLVDGKFSPDGTSIVLSDDVGQIYIINTGQGESQKDAKYDQFFLGDYRPLMQDTHGNVVDQETQLAPYCRNVQDLLCDSSMIPYPEPYQSMYQQRRLGAVGLEWRPPPVKYAVGTDTSIGLQDFQMLPLVDLDRMFDPLPEFIDVMDWEPEIEVQSDDTDSEYNVTEEYSSEAEQGTAGISSFSDSECGEDNEVGHSQKDSLRRSRKKKHKEVEFMTSSGRLVRRRNLDERDGTFSRTNKVKKSRNGRKASRGKSSTSKSSRPRRVAARNALNLFSRISGASTDGEDEVGSEDDSSDSELMNIQSYGSDISMQNGQEKHPREKESFLHTTEGMFRPPEVPRSVENTGNRKRLVLKFSKKPLEGTRSDVEKLVSLVGSSSKHPPATVQAHFGSKEPGSSSGHAVDTMLSQNCCESKIRGRTLYERSEDLLDLPAGYNNNKIRWGEVKARTSKRLRSGMPTDAFPGSTASHEGLKELGDGVDELIKSENKQEMASPCTSVGLSGARSKELAPELVYESGLFKLSSSDELHHRRVASPVNCNGFVNRGTDDQSELCESRDYCEVVKDEKIESSCFTNHFEEAREKLPSSSTKFRIRTKWSLREPESPSKQNPATASEDCRSSACDSILRSPMPMERSLISGVPGEDEGSSGHNQDHRDLMNGIGNSEGLIDKGCSQLALQDLKGLYLDSNNKMYDVAHKRSMSYNARLDSEGDDGARGESSPRSSHNLDLRTDFPEDAPNEPRRTRSMGMNATVQEANSLNCNLRVREHYGSAETSKSAEKFSRKTPEQIPCEEWRSHSKLPVGLRSARIRRGSYYDGDMNLQDKMKSHHSVRKFSWLMLTEHEEGYRYIPQLGDEVIYLRQGHQEFMEMSHTVEAGPWKSIKGNVRATELCKVNELDYSTLAGSGESCCKITLEVVDSTSSVFGRIFKLTLPELNDFPDFIVERTRYDAAMKRNWTHRDKCQVYWREENQEGGSWWEGRILAVKPKSSEFPDSPWERFVVSYKSDSTGTHLHCPWELHDPDIQWEHPHIDVQIREELLDSVTKLEQSSNRKEDYYGIQKLKQVGQKSDFLNRFPVPLSLNIIQQRLQNNYYRSLEALRHDVTVMLFNAQTYFAKNIELSAKMRRLSDWFSEKL